MTTFLLRRARNGLVQLLFGLFLVATLFSSARAQTNDGQWLGINAPHYSSLNSHLSDLGLKAIRMGSGWQQSGKPDEMRYRDDAKISSFAAAGYTLHMAVPYRGYDFNNKKIDVADFETWVSNYKELCRQTISRYGSPGNVKVPYYICGNEPDLNDPFSGNLTPYQAYRFSRALWEAKNQINSSLKTESSPVSSPDATFLREMINAGVADYTDVIGIHAYADQFDDGRLSKPWGWLQTAGKTKPIAISESGVPLGAGWAPSGIDEVLWRTRWHQLAYVQAKRYGIDRMLLFSHTGDTSWTDKWDYRDRQNNFAPVQGAYDEVKYGMRKRTTINGGFESNNDRWHEWVVMQPIAQAAEATWANFTSSNVHSGSRCLKITAGSGTRSVRKVVADLTVGTPYTLSAWIKMVGGSGGARLTAMGYNHTNGDEEVSASAAGYDTWQKLTVTFTPTNSWVVISLSTTGTTASNISSYFDDVTLTTGSPSTTLSGTYKLLARHSGKALTVDASSTADGANVIQYGTDDAYNRLWIVTATDSGYYSLKAKHSGKKLSVDTNPATNGSNNGTATGAGANVVQYGTNDAYNRQWKIESVGSGYYKLTNRQTGRVLDVSGGPSATGDGANVQQWDYSGGTNQQWGLTQISSATSLSAPAATSVAPSPSGGSG